MKRIIHTIIAVGILTIALSSAKRLSPHSSTKSVKIKLNSIVDGVGVRDGVLQYWYDGELIMDYHNLVFRTGKHPDMKINQFLMAPYYGPGVPHEQWIWIDDLRIYTDDGTVSDREGGGS